MLRKTPLKRTGGLKAKRGLASGDGLRADPAKVAAWNERHRGRGFRQHPPVTNDIREIVFRRSDYRCVVCRRKRPLDPHHVLPKDEYPALVLDPANIIGLCRACHSGHEMASRRVLWEELPVCAITLAACTSGAAYLYLERMYPRAA